MQKSPPTPSATSWSSRVTPAPVRRGAWLCASESTPGADSDTGTHPALRALPQSELTIYIVEDSSLRAGPESWARQALNTAAEWMADAMVAEVNNGGDLVFTNVLQVARSEGHTVPNLVPVHASVGKRTPAHRAYASASSRRGSSATSTIRCSSLRCR